MKRMVSKPPTLTQAQQSHRMSVSASLVSELRKETSAPVIDCKKALETTDGDFEDAKQTYDKARDLAKQLAGFYRDLNASFKGLDARVPLEMEQKGRKSIKIWAKSNARLASLYKRKKQPEVAVPLLVEIIRLMTPNSPEGKEAYENLLQLGFVETTYKGF